MRLYNRYVLSLAAVLGAVNSVLALLGETGLDLYVVMNIIAYLVLSLVYVYLNPRARGLLGAMGTVLLAVFLVVVSLRVIEVLGQ